MNYSTKHNRIIQRNCRGLKANYNEILILLSLFPPKIFCLQKTKLKQSDKVNFNNYAAYHYIKTDCQKASGGSSTLIKTDISHNLIDLNTNLQATDVKVSLTKFITICSIYVPPNSKLDQNDLESLSLQLPSPYILMGHFNGHNQLWGCQDRNDKGKIIEEFITENNLCILNNNQSTYLHPAFGT